MKRAFFSLTNKTSVGFSTAAWISFDIAVRPFYGAGDRSVAGFEHIGQEIGHRMDTSHHITICHHHHLYHTTILRRKSSIFCTRKWPFSVILGAKNGTWDDQIQKRRPLFVANFPQKWWNRLFFTRISFSGKFWANSENCVF